jgi:phosphomannomutase
MTAQGCFDADKTTRRFGMTLSPGVAQRVGRAFAETLRAERVVVGHDARASSAGTAQAVAAGLVGAGVEVLDLGLCGAEEVFHATTYFGADGGIAATAQQGDAGFGGLKMVKAGAAPLRPETDVLKMQALAEYGVFAPDKAGGAIRPAKAARGAYLRSILAFVDVPLLRPMKILVNAGHGAAGPTLDALSLALSKQRAHLSFICLNHDPEGSALNGLSDPAPTAWRPMTADAVLASGADMGIAWDSDFGRCFMFDHAGHALASDSIAGLLAECFLSREKGATIAHDPQALRKTGAVVNRLGGRPLQPLSGPFAMQNALRASGAIYGGETSSLHYFRDFSCCNSGMIPWLLIAELMSRRGLSLAALVAGQKVA